MTTLAELKELADDATPGPWMLGWWTGQLPGRYHTCGRRPLLGILGEGYHVHPDDLIGNPHCVSQVGPPFQPVLGNFDGDSGGAVLEADARYIAALSPEVVKALVAVAEAAPSLTADMVHGEDCDAMWDDNGSWLDEEDNSRCGCGLAKVRGALDALKAVLA